VIDSSVFLSMLVGQTNPRCSVKGTIAVTGQSFWGSFPIGPIGFLVLVERSFWWVSHSSRRYISKIVYKNEMVTYGHNGTARLVSFVISGMTKL
jgi:hypothetical protein